MPCLTSYRASQLSVHVRVFRVYVAHSSSTDSIGLTEFQLTSYELELLVKC
jgi:hypothetical protein